MSYHEEQETLDSLKAWWAQWGNLLTWVLLIALIAAAAWNGWNYWQRRQAGAATLLYDQVQLAAAGKDKAMISRTASDMENDYGHTAYAQMTALLAARALYDTGDTAGAKAQLQWAVDHARDSEYRQLARLRLAGVLLDEKAYDAGLKLLVDTPDDGFKGLFAERRGDLLAASGKRDKARDAFRAALASLGTDDASERQLVQFKLDALGG
jgi:predicted negative regulator of RcsB-dependent stress response